MRGHGAIGVLIFKGRSRPETAPVLCHNRKNTAN
jgi:hypothetical protein